jgi:UDP-glucose 4-epimerase
LRDAATEGKIVVRTLVTGGAGFIGSNLVDALLAEGHTVTVVDNFSTGFREFLKTALANPNFTLVEGDLLDQDLLNSAMKDQQVVVHLAANADVRFGWNHPRRDYEQNVLATQNVLEAMRHNEVRRILFSSTGSVYGETTVIPTPENAPFPLQTSLYGASKASAECLISAYAEAGVVAATVFRFVSILGPRYTHGHVIDFVAQLKKNPGTLHILGNGLQRKSYLHVSDCVNAILNRMKAEPNNEVINLGCDEYCEVKDSAKWISAGMGFAPEFTYGGGDRGWVGDNPFILLDTTSMRSHGWLPAFTIRAAVEDTVAWLLQNEDILAAAVTTP